jgi:Leucine-rich repeat (LRR) protein
MKDFKFCFSEGKFSDKAMSLICYDTQEFDIKQINLLNGQNINTFALRNMSFHSNPDDFFELTVNNLIITDSRLDENKIDEPQDGIKIFSNLDIENLFVLTFINNKNSFNIIGWKFFQKFVNLKAIHIEGGKLESLNSMFDSTFGKNILTATFDNTNLDNIEKNIFEKWIKLKMLTITRNLIHDMTWISSKLPNLWYLDLRFNKLNYIPQDLIPNLPSLRILKLGDNKIRVISFAAIVPLLNINEFSFEKTNGKFVNKTI